MQNGRQEWNAHSKLRDSHITGRLSSSEDGAMQANTLMVPRGKGEQWKVSQCSIHVYWFRSVTTAAAKCKMHSSLIIIELSYRYHNIFYLSYCLLIENSIWHIVTALMVNAMLHTVSELWPTWPLVQISCLVNLHPFVCCITLLTLLMGKLPRRRTRHPGLLSLSLSLCRYAEMSTRRKLGE